MQSRIQILKYCLIHQICTRRINIMNEIEDKRFVENTEPSKFAVMSESFVPSAFEKQNIA